MRLTWNRSHRFVAGKIGLCLYRAGGGVNLYGLSVIEFAFIFVDFGHCKGRYIVNDKALDFGGVVGNGVEINIVRADSPMALKKREFA